MTDLAAPAGVAAASGPRLIVNADDWGCEQHTTDRIFDCVRRGTVSAVSAMVFMEDSDRAAGIAVTHDVDAGLHLNFTAPFTGRSCPPALVARHRKVIGYLRGHKLAQLVFNPALVPAFEYVVKAQLDEYRRLYGVDPARLDGHHHMHLCANVLVQRLLPPATIVRRNFSFRPGEKSGLNRGYRRLIDGRLARRHTLHDFLFSLPPLEPATRLGRIFDLARTHVVELETHPVQPDEYRFLMDGDLVRRTEGVRIAPASLPRTAVSRPAVPRPAMPRGAVDSISGGQS
jgi:hypothetical protein